MTDPKPKTFKELEAECVAARASRDAWYAAERRAAAVALPAVAAAIFAAAAVPAAAIFAAAALPAAVAYAAYAAHREALKAQEKTND